MRGELERARFWADTREKSKLYRRIWTNQRERDEATPHSTRSSGRIKPAGALGTAANTYPAAGCRRVNPQPAQAASASSNNEEGHVQGGTVREGRTPTAAQSLRPLTIAGSVSMASDRSSTLSSWCRCSV